MNYQFDVSAAGVSPLLPASHEPSAELLQKILDVQLEQLRTLRCLLAHQDHMARWRYLAKQWREDYPDLPAFSKEVLPTLERAYGGLLTTLVEELRDQGQEAVDNDFALQEFLDRHGMRLGQLGHLLNLLGPLSEAGKRNESTDDSQAAG
jgi:hypothetical protein